MGRGYSAHPSFGAYRECVGIIVALMGLCGVYRVQACGRFRVLGLDCAAASRNEDFYHSVWGALGSADNGV